jgi:hypothetical protein
MGSLRPPALFVSPPKTQTRFLFTRLVILLTLLLLSLSLTEILDCIDQWRRFHVDYSNFSIKSVDVLNAQLILEGPLRFPFLRSLAIRDGHCHCRLFSSDDIDPMSELLSISRISSGAEVLPNDAEKLPHKLLCDFEFGGTHNPDPEFNFVCSAALTINLFGIIIPFDIVPEVETLLGVGEGWETEDSSRRLQSHSEEERQERGDVKEFLNLVVENAVVTTAVSTPSLSPTRLPTRKPSRPPSKIPTRSPTRAPTRTPSSRVTPASPPVTTQVTFTAAMSIQGIDMSMFDMAAQEAFLLVTSQSMEGVPVSALSVVSVSVSLSVSNGTRELLQPHFSSSSSSSTLEVKYSTAVILESFGGRYASVSAMISSLNSQVSLPPSRSL